MKRKFKILVVDDEPDVVELIKSRLEAEGYDIVVAYSGISGLAAAKKELPDLVILDVMMADLDGGEVAEKLKEDRTTKDIPVIFLTCMVKKDELHQGVGKIGENIFIAKPFKSQDLIPVVRHLLKQ